MVRNCNNIVLAIHRIQVHTARVISTTKQWVCYLASFFRSDAMFKNLPPPFWCIKAHPLIPSGSYTAERILKHLILYVIKRESCRHLCLPTVHTYFKCWVTLVNRHMATGWGTPCTNSEGAHNRCNRAYKNYLPIRTRVNWDTTSCWWVNCYPHFRISCCSHFEVTSFIYFLINTPLYPRRFDALTPPWKRHCWYSCLWVLKKCVFWA
jgi:hypothetical protein